MACGEASSPTPAPLQPSQPTNRMPLLHIILALAAARFPGHGLSSFANEERNDEQGPGRCSGFDL